MRHYTGIVLWTMALFYCLLVSAGCARDPTAARAPSCEDPAAAGGLAKGRAVIPLTTQMVVKAGIDTQQVRGDIKNVFYASDNTVLIEADKLYLYDLPAGKVVAQALLENFNQPRFQPIAAGYAAIGDIKGSMNGKVVFYSGSLEKESELSFSQITQTDEPLFAEGVAVSPDGKKIAYQDGRGIAVYDAASQSVTRILDLESAAGSSIWHVSQLIFTGNDSLAFLSGAANPGGASIPACGKINVDGTGLVNQAVPGFVAYEIAGAYDAFSLLGEDDRSLSGRAALQDAATGAISFLPMETRQERAVFGSDAGAYYATCALDSAGCTARVYETRTGSKVFEQSIPHGGNPLYAARIPVIRVLDKSRTCIVLMGNRQEDLATIAKCFNF